MLKNLFFPLFSRDLVSESPEITVCTAHAKHDIAGVEQNLVRDHFS